VVAVAHGTKHDWAYLAGQSPAAKHTIPDELFHHADV
jgi:hypothetical protein